MSEQDLRPLSEIHASYLRAHHREASCDGEHHSMALEGGYLYAWQCNCNQLSPAEKRVAALRHRFGVSLADGKPHSLENFHPTTPPQETALAAAREFCQHQDIGVLFHGSTGCGKTHLAKAIAYEMAKRSTSIEFVHSAYLAKLFSQSCSMDEDQADPAKASLTDLRTRKVLVLDDLGAESVSNLDLFQREFMLFLEDFQGLLVITTNLDGEALIAKIGRRNYSRIIEKCPPIGVNGPDYRLKTNRERTRKEA